MFKDPHLNILSCLSLVLSTVSLFALSQYAEIYLEGLLIIVGIYAGLGFSVFTCVYSYFRCNIVDQISVTSWYGKYRYYLWIVIYIYLSVCLSLFSSFILVSLNRYLDLGGTRYIRCVVEEQMVREKIHKHYKNGILEYETEILEYMIALPSCDKKLKYDYLSVPKSVFDSRLVVVAVKQGFLGHLWIQGIEVAKN